LFTLIKFTYSMLTTNEPGTADHIVHSCIAQYNVI
jgi:hypothetical protein